MNSFQTNIRGLLIDMDGTLVDHIDTLTRCFQHATRKLGYPEPDAATVRRSIGGSMPVSIRKFLPEEKAEEGKALWRQHFDEIHLEGILVLPGARELLAHCQANAMPAAVFTNKTGHHTRAMVEQERLAPLLAFSLGAEDTPYRKPEPEFSKIAIERLGIPAENIAMVGNSPFDIQAAKAGGMTSLCITTGSHAKNELADEGADHVFENLLDLLAWLQK